MLTTYFHECPIFRFFLAKQYIAKTSSNWLGFDKNWNLGLGIRGGMWWAAHCILYSTAVQYGNMGCGVFKRGVVLYQKALYLRIGTPKGNFWILRIGLAGSFSSLQKSQFLKLNISFLQYFWCQNWDQWHILSGKNIHIFFFLLLVQK